MSWKYEGERGLTIIFFDKRTWPQIGMIFSQFFVRLVVVVSVSVAVVVAFNDVEVAAVGQTYNFFKDMT